MVCPWNLVRLARLPRFGWRHTFSQGHRRLGSRTSGCEGSDDQHDSRIAFEGHCTVSLEVRGDSCHDPAGRMWRSEGRSGFEWQGTESDPRIGRHWGPCMDRISRSKTCWSIGRFVGGDYCMMAFRIATTSRTDFYTSPFPLLD